MQLYKGMETRKKPRDKLNLSELTTLNSNAIKQLSKSQTSLYRVSPLLTHEEAVLHRGHSHSDINKLNTGVRGPRASSATERVLRSEIRKSSTPSSELLTKLLSGQRSFPRALGDEGNLTASMPSLFLKDAEKSPTQSPKRRGHRYSKQRKSLKTQSVHTLIDCRETSLADFVSRYSDSLPVQVEIQNGYYSQSNPICLSRGDTCNVYFLHHIDAVTGTIQGISISVPLHTDLQVCLVHNPDCNAERALMGYEYETIQDIIASSPRPKLIRSLSLSKHGHVTIDRDELLVIVGTILLPRDDTVWLEAFSLNSHKTLHLHPKCSGKFTTRPQLLPLALSDVAEYVPEPFPCTVLTYAYQTADTSEAKVIDLHSRSVESLIVCSSTTSSEPLFVLPANCAVTVTLLPMKSSDEGLSLREQTRNVLENFNPARCDYLVDIASSSLYEFQIWLYRTMKRETAADSMLAPSLFDALSPRHSNTFFKTPGYNSAKGDLCAHASQVRKISCEPQMRPECIVYLAQNSLETVSSPSSLSDGSAKSSSEPTPPTPPRPLRLCMSAQDDMLVLPFGSEESLYLSPLCSQVPKVLNLFSFAKRYSNHFPVVADVKDGYVFQDGIQISRGDVLTVHGIAYTEGVSVKDDQGKVYILPMDATSEFGVLQDDSFRQLFGDEAEFDTIGEIISNENVPKILCARSQYNTGNQRSSVEANEVLVVRKVKKLSKILKVYSVTHEMKKNLAAKCAGHFTTAPRAVKLVISKLLQFFPTFLPGKAVAFPDTYCSELPAQLEFSIVTLSSIHPANSLVFSCSPQDVVSGELQLFSVSLDHYLHLQPHEGKPNVSATLPAINYSRSMSVPQINVSCTFPRLERSSLRESPEWKVDNVKFLSTLNENNVSDVSLFN